MNQYFWLIIMSIIYSEILSSTHLLCQTLGTMFSCAIESLSLALLMCPQIFLFLMTWTMVRSIRQVFLKNIPKRTFEIVIFVVKHILCIWKRYAPWRKYDFFHIISRIHAVNMDLLLLFLTLNIRAGGVFAQNFFLVQSLPLQFHFPRVCFWKGNCERSSHWSRELKCASLKTDYIYKVFRTLSLEKVVCCF